MSKIMCWFDDCNSEASKEVKIESTADDVVFLQPPENVRGDYYLCDDCFEKVETDGRNNS